MPPDDTLAVHADVTYVVVILAEKDSAMKHAKWLGKYSRLKETVNFFLIWNFKIQIDNKILCG